MVHCLLTMSKPIPLYFSYILHYRSCTWAQQFHLISQICILCCRSRSIWLDVLLWSEALSEICFMNICGAMSITNITKAARTDFTCKAMYVHTWYVYSPDILAMRLGWMKQCHVEFLRRWYSSNLCPCKVTHIYTLDCLVFRELLWSLRKPLQPTPHPWSMKTWV